MAQGDGATVDIDLVHIGFMRPRPREHDRGERLVDLDQVDIAELHPGLLQHPGGGLHRSVQVVVGFGADVGLGDDASTGLEPECACLVFVHPQHRRRTVGDLRRRARGVNAALQHRLQRREPLGGGVAQALVARHRRPFCGRLLVLVEHRGGDG